MMDCSNGDSDDDAKFPPIKLLLKKKISDEYILHSAVNNLVQGQFAVVLTTHEILQFDVTKQTKILSVKGHEKSITGIKFSSKTPSLLFTSSIDGNIHAWDLRSSTSPVQSFSDDSDGPLKPLTCFDFNLDETHLCAGTELIRSDSFILFWDQRTSEKLGGYWNSHTDEITQVQFSSTCDSGLATSSVDGLINIFDLTQSTDDEALINTLNTECSVNKFAWGLDDHVSCITGNEEYQFWSVEETKPSVSSSRESISTDSQCNIDYLIDTFVAGQSFCLAAGTNKGSVQLYCQKKKSLKTIGLLKNGHTDIVRTISYNKGHFLLTGGEDGQICTWKISL
ncbi:WD repeat-containing protein 89 [Trichonephila inaurata madagascariensis]|uniref:WD repeat-containing protein 89 n=1 Tax=Trichonephila inaurata madagascariensis TaxID=2747483 RepID=A0A8X7CQ15_9ARAC|nr:WD repeat-containing protein 89 [Trichonephila inaurata madagascariensis]